MHSLVKQWKPALHAYIHFLGQSRIVPRSGAQTSTIKGAQVDFVYEADRRRYDDTLVRIGGFDMFHYL